MGPVVPDDKGGNEKLRLRENQGLASRHILLYIVELIRGNQLRLHISEDREILLVQTG